jgi:hypothetical protein
MIALEFTFNTFSNGWKKKKKKRNTEHANIFTHFILHAYMLFKIIFWGILWNDVQWLCSTLLKIVIWCHYFLYVPKSSSIFRGAFVFSVLFTLFQMVEKEKKKRNTEHANIFTHFILHAYMLFSSWKMLWIWRKCVWSFLPFIFQINCKSMKHSTVATSGRGTPHTWMRDGAFKNKLCIVADFAELF